MARTNATPVTVEVDVPDAWTRSRCTNWLELAPVGRSAIGRRLTIRLTELGRLSAWRLLTFILQ
jgi:hypothetical protein